MRTVSQQGGIDGNYIHASTHLDSHRGVGRGGLMLGEEGRRELQPCQCEKKHLVHEQDWCREDAVRVQDVNSRWTVDPVGKR